MKNILKYIFITFGILTFGFIMRSALILNVSAASCSKSTVDAAVANPNNGTNANNVLKCTCKENSSFYNSCNSIQQTILYNKSLKDIKGQTVTTWKFNLATDKATGQTKYYSKMNALISFIGNIVNAVIGIIIFILGGGFLWNVTQMGIHSNNAQKREECISRLGDVFATAMFLGLIPIIMQFLTSIMGNLS